MAAQLKDAAAAGQLPNYRILTDLRAFNRVVLEYDARVSVNWKARMHDYDTNETFREKMKATHLWIPAAGKSFGFLNNSRKSLAVLVWLLFVTTLVAPATEKWPDEQHYLRSTHLHKDREHRIVIVVCLSSRSASCRTNSEVSLS